MSMKRRFGKSSLRGAGTIPLWHIRGIGGLLCRNRLLHDMVIEHISLPIQDPCCPYLLIYGRYRGGFRALSVKLNSQNFHQMDSA